MSGQNGLDMYLSRIFLFGYLPFVDFRLDLSLIEFFIPKHMILVGWLPCDFRSCEFGDQIKQIYTAPIRLYIHSERLFLP